MLQLPVKHSSPNSIWDQLTLRDSESMGKMKYLCPQLQVQHREKKYRWALRLFDTIKGSKRWNYILDGAPLKT